MLKDKVSILYGILSKGIFIKIELLNENGLYERVSLQGISVI